MGKGGEGGIELANQVFDVMQEPQNFKHLYELKQPLEAKIETIVKEIYGGSKVNFSSKAQNNKSNLKRMAGMNIRFVWLKLNIHLVMIRHC